MIKTTKIETENFEVNIRNKSFRAHRLYLASELLKYVEKVDKYKSYKKLEDIIKPEKKFFIYRKQNSKYSSCRIDFGLSGEREDLWLFIDDYTIPSIKKAVLKELDSIKNYSPDFFSYSAYGITKEINSRLQDKDKAEALHEIAELKSTLSYLNDELKTLADAIQKTDFK